MSYYLFEYSCLEHKPYTQPGPRVRWVAFYPIHSLRYFPFMRFSGCSVKNICYYFYIWFAIYLGIFSKIYITRAFAVSVPPALSIVPFCFGVALAEISRTMLSYFHTSIKSFQNPCSLSGGITHTSASKTWFILWITDYIHPTRTNFDLVRIVENSCHSVYSSIAWITVSSENNCVEILFYFKWIVFYSD